MQNEVLDALSGYIYNPRSAWWWGNTNIGWNFIQMSWAMPSTTAACSESCSNTEWTEKLICEWKCCIKSCEQISNLADRAVCLSQCLCWEISVANDILRIKICRVPAQASQVIAGKKISSIEQAVDEINQVFLKLKQNGALIKRTKTQEFLDSSFSSIKFHKILAFDIFVAIKPIYDILQVDQVKKNSKDDEQLLSTINGTTGQRWKGKDRIKYASSGLNGTLEENNNLCAWYGTTYDRTTKNCRWGLKNEAIVSALGQSQSVNKRNDMIAWFLNEHYSFWDEVYNHIVEIQLTTENLKMKAEDSK